VLKTVQYIPLGTTALSTELDSAHYGQPYSEQLVATGGTPPYAWSIIGGALPGEYTLFADGRITSPVVSNAGQFPLTFRVVDQFGGADSVQLVLTTIPLLPPPTSFTIYPVPGSSLVRMRWKTIAAMDSFMVWRSTDFEMTNRVLIGTTAELQFTDSSAATNPDSLTINRVRFYSVTGVRNE
jgi:hypothetical protein